MHQWPRVQGGVSGGTATETLDLGTHEAAVAVGRRWRFIIGMAKERRGTAQAADSYSWMMPPSKPRPAASHEDTTPTQNRLWWDEEGNPPLSGDQAGERSDERPI